MKRLTPVHYALVAIVVLLGVLTTRCASAQFTPNVDSLMTVWDTETVSSATFVNPEDSDNYFDVWFNIEGVARVIRYYDNDLILYACTLTGGCFTTTSALRQMYSGALAATEEDRQRLNALLNDHEVIDR